MVSDSHHRQAVTVPAEAPVHVEAVLMGKPGHNVLDGSGQDVAIVRQTGGKGRPVIEREPDKQINETYMH